MTRSRFLPLILAASLVVATTACLLASPSSGASTQSGAWGDETMTPVQAAAALGSLPVSAPDPMTGYSRAQFPHWRSAGANGWDTSLLPGGGVGCDAREAALIRDGEDVTTGSGCSPQAGIWTDPYTGATVTNPSLMDVDHMVPLAEAWRSGADQWTTDERRAYANNPLVLVTAGASANRSKGDSAPQDWKPADTDSWCVYSIRWIEVKSAYGLWLTDESERSALTAMLDTCGRTDASPVVPTPSPSVTVMVDPSPVTTRIPQTPTDSSTASMSPTQTPSAPTGGSASPTSSSVTTAPTSPVQTTSVSPAATPSASPADPDPSDTSTDSPVPSTTMSMTADVSSSSSPVSSSSAAPSAVGQSAKPSTLPSSPSPAGPARVSTGGSALTKGR